MGAPGSRRGNICFFRILKNTSLQKNLDKKPKDFVRYFLEWCLHFSISFSDRGGPSSQTLIVSPVMSDLFGRAATSPISERGHLNGSFTLFM